MKYTVHACVCNPLKDSQADYRLVYQTNSYPDIQKYMSSYWQGYSYKVISTLDKQLIKYHFE